MRNRFSQSGFTLVEIAIVLLIVTILLGYTVALFPQQQRLKQYRALERDMDRVIEAIVGFAQVNGRLPCPSLPDSLGAEDYNDTLNDGCNHYGGFVPVNTLGLDGRRNGDSLLLDPWGNPYRYYVTDIDTDVSGNANISDFTSPGEMRAVGLEDVDADDYIDLDGRYIICDSAGTAANRCAGGANAVVGRFLDGNAVPDDHNVDDRYGGAPFVLVSMGQNWNEVNVPTGDELVNSGASLSDTDLTLGVGPTGADYLLKDVASNETTFVLRPGGFADDYDDVVRWVSPSVLFSRMIQADKLP